MVSGEREAMNLWRGAGNGVQHQFVEQGPGQVQLFLPCLEPMVFSAE